MTEGLEHKVSVYTIKCGFEINKINIHRNVIINTVNNNRP